MTKGVGGKGLLNARLPRVFFNKLPDEFSRQPHPSFSQKEVTRLGFLFRAYPLEIRLAGLNRLPSDGNHSLLISFATATDESAPQIQIFCLESHNFGNAHPCG